MELILDNIVFSLQKAGGISVVWSENMKRLLVDNDIDITCLEYGEQNFLRKKIHPNDNQIINLIPRLSLKLERYLNPSINLKKKNVFHSSYYRCIEQPEIYNITTVHDFTYEYFRTGISKKIHYEQKLKAIRNSEKIICISENTKLDLLKFHPWLPEERIEVIYNGVDETYRVVNDEVDNIPFDNGGYLLYVGDRKSNHKNFNQAVEASIKVNMPLLLVGSALSKKEKQYLDFKLNKDYFLLSGITNEELNLLYNNAFCFLYPSSYEGFGIPILEAQRAGCPIISSNSSSIPEVSGNGAILLNEINSDLISEALNSLRNNNQFKTSLISLGLENSKKFSWDKCFEQTKKVYLNFK